MPFCRLVPVRPHELADAAAVGAALMVRMSALVLALLVARWADSTVPLFVVAAVGGLAIGSLAWNRYDAIAAPKLVRLSASALEVAARCR